MRRIRMPRKTLPELSNKCYYYDLLYRISKFSGVTSHWKCSYVPLRDPQSPQTPGVPRRDANLGPPLRQAGTQTT